MLSSLLINLAWRLGAVPPATEMPAEHVAIKNAMARQDDNAVRQQIDEASLSPDALQALLAHAFLQNRSLAIKESLLRHPRCDFPTRQTALDFALQYNDLPLARQALQQNADPEKITARPQADDMRSLLTYARRKNKLYPSNASRAQDTNLDRALQNGHADVIQAFGELLEELVPENQRAELLLLAAKDVKNLPGLYFALQKGHADAIRAFGKLLLLVPEDQRAELLAAKDINGVPGLYAALMIGNTDAIHEFGELLHQVSPKERAQLLAITVNGCSGLAEALKEGKLEALEQYIEIVKKTEPVLSAQDRAALLTYIRKSHAVQKWGMWFNTSHYEALKKKNPDFHFRFTEMLNALQP